MASSFAGPNSSRLFFFLWGYLESKVYSTRPTDLRALQENIREEIPKLLEETLQAVMRSFLTCVLLCTEEGGGHLKDIVHKKWNCKKKVKHDSKLWRAKIGISYFQ